MELPRSLPNQITIARLVLAVLLFVNLHAVAWAQANPFVNTVLEPRHQAGTPDEHARALESLGRLAAERGLSQQVSSEPWGTYWAVQIAARERLLLNLAAAIFFLAAISDILDGQIARRWNLTTDFGRIADPFADKVVVIGAFLFLASIAGSGVAAWMVVVIVARESLVDGIRGFAESRGIAFPSSFWGKAKMVAQSACVTWLILRLANFRGFAPVEIAVDGLLAFTLFVTVFSGALYVLRARSLLGRGAGGETLRPNAATQAASR